MPPTRSGLREYVSDICRDLAVGPDSRRLARKVSTQDPATCSRPARLELPLDPRGPAACTGEARLRLRRTGTCRRTCRYRRSTTAAAQGAQSAAPHPPHPDEGLSPTADAVGGGNPSVVVTPSDAICPVAGRVRGMKDSSVTRTKSVHRSVRLYSRRGLVTQSSHRSSWSPRRRRK